MAEALAASTSSVTGVVGEMLTPVATGAVLPMVTTAATGEPVCRPSSGVTVQVTTSSLAITPPSVALVPTVVPAMLQARVDWSLSPSASLKPDQAQVRVSLGEAGSGVMVTDVIAGAELSTVTLALTTVPVSKPSDGVTSQVTTSPRTKAPA